MSKNFFKRAAMAVVLCCGMAGIVRAQPMNPQLEGYINSEIRRRNQENQGSGYNTRAQIARERQLQREIAELRRTPFYSAIAYDFVNKRVLGGGYYSEKRAVEKVLGRCQSSNCQVVTTFANTCAMIAWPDTGIKTANDWFVGFDNDPQQAIVKSVRACEAKHGYNQCSYSDMKTKTGNALCSGYDYSIYGQH